MKPLGSCGRWKKSWKGSCPPPHLNRENHQGVFCNTNGELDPWKMCSGERHPSFWNTFWSYSSGNCADGKTPLCSLVYEVNVFRGETKRQMTKLPSWPGLSSLSWKYYQLTILNIVTKHLTKAVIGRVCLAHRLRVYFLMAGNMLMGPLGCWSHCTHNEEAERFINVTAQLAFSFLFSPRPQTMD